MDEFKAQFEVRDHRRKEMYRVDDEYLNGYARLCGIYATGVYNCLCRHANHLTQTSFPSVETMAEKLDISRDSVIRGLKNLEKWNIIKKEKTRSAKTGEWIHNSYTLVDKAFWVPKPDQVAHSNVAPGRSQRLHQVAHSDSKDANRKDTNIVLQAKPSFQEREQEPRIEEDTDSERGFSRKGDPAVVRVERKFLDKVKTELSQVVPPSAAGRMLVKRALSRMSEEDCMEKIEDWFTRSLADQRLMSIKACFSDNEVNGWLAAYEK